MSRVCQLYIQQEKIILFKEYVESTFLNNKSELNSKYLEYAMKSINPLKNMALDIIKNIKNTAFILHHRNKYFKKINL